MKYFDSNIFSNLQDDGYAFAACIVHLNKDGYPTVYLYPFRDLGFAEYFISECQEHNPQLFELNASLLQFISEGQYIEVYLSSISDLYMRASYFNNSEINFMLFDDQLNATDINESMVNSYHFERKRVIGQNFKELSSTANEKGLYDKFMEVIRTGQPLTLDDITGDLRYGVHHYRLKAFKVGNGLGISCSDISNLKNLIHVLEQYAYRSSHDIRSPITSVLGLINMANNQNEQNSSTLRHYLSLISDEIRKLDSITMALLESLKLERQERAPENINFIKLVNEAKQGLSYIDGFNTVTFQETIADIKNFYSDRIVLLSLFQNLIDNAIKYRNRNIEKSVIKIKIVTLGQNLEITISDNGIGIAEKEQQHIFSLFYRANTEIAGNGLGLYTLKQSIEKLGGKITFKSKENSGTTFIILLPNKKTT